MRVRAVRAGGIGLVLCGFLLGGCGSDSPYRPLRDVDRKTVRIALDVELSSQDGSAGSPITVRATARNLGSARVYATPGTSSCGACDGLVFEIRGPDDKKVWLTNPCLPQPVCLCALTSLEPGATLPRSLPFDGSVHRVLSQAPPECVLEQAASGEYTAVVRYSYYTENDYSTRTLEKRVTFRWTGP